MSDILIWDTGLAVEHANRLQRDGHNVKYFTFWSSEGFPKFKSYVPGKGIVPKLLYFFEELEKIDIKKDIVMFPDIGVGDLAEYLKKRNYNVWGAGKGEILEIRRDYSKRIMRQLGINYPESIICEGIEELRENLKKNENVFVKLNIFRGDVETFFARNYDDVELLLDKLELDFGAFAKDTIFIVEKAMEGVEPGFDLIFDGDDYCYPYLYGYELKGTGTYIGKFTEKLPEPLGEIAEKIKPFLKECDYRGAISSEMIVKDNKAYLIDWTTRFPYPLSAIYTEVFENYSDIIINVSKKQKIDIKNKAKYVGSVALESEFAKENWLLLNFKEEFKNKIKVRIGTKFDEKYFAVPGFSSVLVIIGWGDSLEEVKNDIRNTIEKAEIQAIQISKETGGLDLIEKIIEKGKKEGVEF